MGAAEQHGVARCGAGGEAVVQHSGGAEWGAEVQHSVEVKHRCMVQALRRAAQQVRVVSLWAECWA